MTNVFQRAGRVKSLLCLLLTAKLSQPSGVADGTLHEQLVIPSGLEQREAVGGSGVIHVRNREQTVYGSNHFPAQPIWIEGLKFRPNVFDGTPGRAFTTTISNLQINLSTTARSPDGLSSTFANNIGANETVVFNGSITVSSEFSGPAQGPKTFDIVVPLQRRFLYDPSKGNLLLDVRDFSGEATCYIDAENSTSDSASRVLSQNVTASTGAVDTGANVIQVDYMISEEPPPLARHDLSDDFAGTLNPNGVWSYGWQNTLGGTFDLMCCGRVAASDNGVPVQYWDDRPASPPSVFHNATTNTATSDGGQGVFPPKTTWFGPGIEGNPENYAIIRFTVPSNGCGTYRLESSVRSALNGASAGDTDFHVLKNGAELFGASLAPRSGTNFSDVLSLAAGDRIDFAVGRGADGRERGSILKISATLNLIARGPDCSNNVVRLVVPAGRESIEAAGGSGVLDVVNREQTVYHHSHFPVSDIVIREILFRPNIVDGTRGRAFTNITISNIQVRLSTTAKQPDGLSNVFAQNSGADEILVYSGSLTISSGFHGPANGPKEFDIRIPLQHPFRYRPTLGNLLMDIQNFSGETTSIVDAENSTSDLSSRVVAPGNAAATLGVPDTGADVVQIVYSLGGTNEPLARYDVSRGFSTNTNPAGVWSYGWQNTLGGFFTLFPRLKSGLADNGVRMWLWEKEPAEPASVFHNPTEATGTSDGGQGIYPPGTTWFFPGVEGHQDNYGLIRFTVPPDGSGAYRLSTTVRSYLDGDRSGDTDFHVLKNGQEIFGQFLPPRSGTSYSNTVVLAAGDTLDFAVGRGADNRVHGSGLKIEVALDLVSRTEAPPPLARYDVSDDFSTNTNPAGVWSYGWQNTLGGSFTLFPKLKSGLADNGFRMWLWEKEPAEPASVFHNPTEMTGTSDGGQGVYPPGTTWFFPGVEGHADNFGVIRFTAPGDGAGTYRLSTAVRSYLDGPSSGDTDFHVLRNGVELFGQFLGPRSGTNFSATLTLAAGDTIDFAIGRGADDRVYGSGLKIEAQLELQSATPLPPAIVHQPQGQSAAEGSDVTLSVVANGSAPLAYQWFFDGELIEGATSSSLTLSNILVSQSGGYSVVVTNVLGAVTSQVAVVTVHSEGGELTLVIPRGLEAREAAGGSGVIHVRNREQTLYSATHFSAHPIWIEGLKFRPNVVDGTPGRAFTTTISDLRITLSTSSRAPDSMSPEFSSNTGTNETVVFEGAVTLASQFSGPAAGPKTFDIIIPLQQRFLYNPSQGNLLLDIRNFSGEATCYVDAENSALDSASRVVAQSATATSGVPDTGADVIELQYRSADALQVYDASRDFSTNSNPDGVWSYGWQNTLGGSFTLFPRLKSGLADNGVRMWLWEKEPAEPASVFHNPTEMTGTSDGGQGIYPPGTTWFFPGVEGHADNFGVIRFTTPSEGAGTYRLSTSVRSYLDGSSSGDTDFHVLQNGIEIFGQFLSPRSGTNYTSNIVLGPGDTVDFAIGRGADNRVFGSGLKIQAQLMLVSTNATPVILVQPQGRTIPEGGTATFSVVASGAHPLGYQWRVNGSSIPGATSASLTVTGATADDAGSYSVEVRNAHGFVVSANAVLEVIPPQPVPRIAAISPTVGPIGFSVTITGENFSATAEQNVVYFGAVRAEVTSATATSLTVRVPNGATYGPVSVIVGGRVGYSSSAFSVTFPSSGVLDTSFLAPRANLAAADGPIHTSLGDIDGDGRPDLVVANHYSASVSVYRNISAVGSLGPGSFAPRLDFPTGALPQRLALGDIDGDGRLDIVTPDAGNNRVSVLRNTSTTAGISFAPRVDFPVGNYPHSIAIGDLDGDGRLDIATANYYSDTVSVLRNTGTVGIVDSSSFADQVTHAVGDGPHTIAIGDLNGDGRADIAVGNFDSVTTSLLRNTSSAGALSFARSDLSGGGNHVAIGDLDQDGKPDLVVGYWRGYNMFLFRNTSSGEALSFAPRSEVGIGANTHTISIGDLDGDGRPDLAVVAEQPSFLKVFKNNSSAGSLSFGPSAQFSAGWNAVGVSVGDIDLDGNPDIAFCNFYDDTLSVYRNVIGPQTPGGDVGLIIPRGLEAREASGGSGVLDHVNREQTVYAASHFPTHPIWLEEIHFRPNIVDGTVGRAFSNTISRLQIAFSTTSRNPDNLSSTFAANTGPDQVIGFDGPITLTSGFAGPASGPKSFDIVIRLTHPFRYDPAAGNLLMDIRNFSGEHTSIVDAENSTSDSASRLVAPFNASASVGNPDTGANVLKVVYRVDPEPSLVVPRGRETNEAAGGSGVLYVANREQTVYAASQFPAHPIVIRELLLRPNIVDGTRGRAFTNTISNIQIHLSTTQRNPDALSSQFAENRGSDNTLVHSGPLTLSSRFTGPANGPRDFDIRIPLQQPFLYNPALGNLLLDVQNFSGEPTSYVDAENSPHDLSSRLVAPGNANATVGAPDTGADVLKIVYSLTGTNPPQPGRIFIVGSPPDAAEGQIVAVPIHLASDGEVGGFTVTLNYNPDLLSATDVAWDSALFDAFKQWNVPQLGRLRLVVGSSDSPIPGGTQMVASVQFRARTVAATAGSELRLQVVDVSGETGEVLADATGVQNGRVTIVATGSTDNNGNNRLDVGDATLLMRLLAGMDSIRTWDVSRNDLNRNALLDSGDVIKVLRVASGIDPQPGGASPSPAAAETLVIAASTQSTELASLSPLRLAGTNGQLIKVRVRLDNLNSTISGAAFTLTYPTSALRLAAAQPHRTGAMVPGNSLAVWNASEPGQLRLAVSSDSAWLSTDGVLAEIAFEVLPGAAAQHVWPIGLGAVEVTPDGYAPRGVATQGAQLVGRSAVGGRLSAARRGASGEFIFSFSGDAGASYAIQASTDLVNWVTLTNVVNATGTVEMTDPDAASFPHRFYRTVPLE